MAKTVKKPEYIYDKSPMGADYVCITEVTTGRNRHVKIETVGTVTNGDHSNLETTAIETINDLFK